MIYLFIGRVIIGDFHDDATFRLMEKARKDVVQHGNDIIAILQVVCAPTLLSGIESLLQIAGFGKLKPNTILFGFKESWKESSDRELYEYVSIIRSCFMTEHSVCIFRNQHVPLMYTPENEIIVPSKEHIGKFIYIDIILKFLILNNI